MNKFKSILSACLLGALVNCASPSGNQGATNGYDLSPQARLYGEYLAGSYASYLNDADARSGYFSRAFARKPGDVTLGRKALLSAVSAGEMPLARVLAIEVQNLDSADELSRAVLATEEMRKGNYKEAEKVLSAVMEDQGLSDINGLIRGWAQVGADHEEAGLTSFSTLTGGKYFELIGTLQSAKVYAAKNQREEFTKAIGEINEIGIASIESLLTEVRFEIAQGNREKATELLTAFGKKNGGVYTGPVRVYLDALEAGTDIGRELTPAEQASRALTEPAFAYFGVQKQHEAAEVFLRLALELDPKNDKARLFLGSILEDLERVDDAAAEYRKISQDSEYSVSARLSEASIFFEKDEDAKGLKTLNTAYDLNPSRVTKEAIGRAYLILEDYENALPYYDALIKDMSTTELLENPQPRYLRGICLERLGRWEEAVADFEFVLAAKPDNADALNYLGYTWVDKGVNLTKAFDMIRKAVKIEPESGAIIDSLGWAHYKLGQYSEARISLEDAVERSPNSATIIDHLGDVYWKLGRRKEAGYQWQRALEFDPTDEERKNIKAKLKGGLSAVKTD